jgi:hypothetical protein
MRSECVQKDKRYMVVMIIIILTIKKVMMTKESS